MERAGFFPRSTATFRLPAVCVHGDSALNVTGFLGFPGAANDGGGIWVVADSADRDGPES
jgi:hypothetical protein